MESEVGIGRAFSSKSQLADKRKAIIAEAENAIRETRGALAALDEKKSEDALAALERARSELKVAEALGYGGRMDYASCYAELEKIEHATRGQALETGLFDKLRKSLGKLRDKLFG